MTMRQTPTRRPTLTLAPFFYAMVLIGGVYLSVDAWTSPTLTLWKAAGGGILLGFFAARAVRR